MLDKLFLPVFFSLAFLIISIQAKQNQSRKPQTCYPQLHLYIYLSLYLCIHPDACQVKVMAQLKHPNIVRYYESYMDRKGNLNIVMEYCGGGDLYTRIKNSNGKFFEEEVSEYRTRRAILRCFLWLWLSSFL